MRRDWCGERRRRSRHQRHWPNCEILGLNCGHFRWKYRNCQLEFDQRRSSEEEEGSVGRGANQWLRFSVGLVPSLTINNTQIKSLGMSRLVNKRVYKNWIGARNEWKTGSYVSYVRGKGVKYPPEFCIIFFCKSLI